MAEEIRVKLAPIGDGLYRLIGVEDTEGHVWKGLGGPDAGGEQGGEVTGHGHSGFQMRPEQQERHRERLYRVTIDGVDAFRHVRRAN